MIKKGDYNKFNELMGGIDWKSEFDKYPNDVNEQWEFFRSKYIEAEKNVSRINWFILTGNYLRNFLFPSTEPIWENLRKKINCGEKLEESWHQKRKIAI